MPAPPLSLGALNAMEIPVTPGITTPIVGAAGTAAIGRTDFGVDNNPVPMEFVAETVQLYGVPFVRPDSLMGLLRPLTLCVPHFNV